MGSQGCTVRKGIFQQINWVIKNQIQRHLKLEAGAAGKGNIWNSIRYAHLWGGWCPQF